MINVGIIGFGFMGHTHLSHYNNIKGVKVKAICDIDKERLHGKKSIAGNINTESSDTDLSGVELYTDYREMLKLSALDAVSVTVPTPLHTEMTIAALEHGIHVLCEKPMALSIPECRKMTTASTRNGKLLQIGHCIRFWPGYDIAKAAVASKKYGEVKAAAFRRLSLTPAWAWKNWITNGELSGGASLDMHIHDSDFVRYLFGMPEAVASVAANGVSGDFDHISTNFYYPGLHVTAEGGWMMAPGFGFEMSFYIVMEKATLLFDSTRTPVFKICMSNGEVIVPELKKGDGYSIEINHFISSIKGEKPGNIISPEDSLNSVRLVLAEKASALNRKKVKIP